MGQMEHNDSFVKLNDVSFMFKEQSVSKTSHHIAFLFQNLGLFPWKTVLQSVSMPLKLKGEICLF
jgi:ABC-type nitrate/sulfonate/bicarbonate transport system ATPase subunit